jgi:PAS domain-containing protein
VFYAYRQRDEAHRGSLWFRVPDLRAAEHGAVEKARDFLLKQQSPVILPEFFVEISGEFGELLTMMSLRRLLFGEAITDPHRRLCDFIPYPWLRVNGDLVVQDANLAYLRATLKNHASIAGHNMFEIFPDNPGDPTADGVRNLSTSLRNVLRTRQPHRMARQRYDVRARSGAWLLRRWSPINVPVLDHNGEVVAIVHHVEDVTAPVSPNRSFGRTGRVGVGASR